MDMPPTRYQVIERGRRLIVVDRWNDGAPVSSLAPEAREKLDRLQQRMRSNTSVSQAAAPRIASGKSNVITTQPWFDDKAPRRVRIGEKQRNASGVTVVVIAVGAFFALIWLGWFVLPVVVILLLQPGVRKGLRKGVTAWLDGMEQV